ncbi:hypothetical protein BST61_g5844 [Cercospora zeina]
MQLLRSVHRVNCARPTSIAQARDDGDQSSTASYSPVARLFCVLLAVHATAIALKTVPAPMPKRRPWLHPDLPVDHATRHAMRLRLHTRSRELLACSIQEIRIRPAARKLHLTVGLGHVAWHYPPDFRNRRA